MTLGLEAKEPEMGGTQEMKNAVHHDRRCCLPQLARGH